MLVVVLLRSMNFKLTEEHKEGEAVENQDVGDMGDTGLRQEQHLLFGCTQEEEATGV